jgi:hypothetical protein
MAAPMAAALALLTSAVTIAPSPLGNDAAQSVATSLTGATQGSSDTDMAALKPSPAARSTFAQVTSRELHGLIAAALRLSNTGTYGAPLVAGCQWASWVDQCANLTAYGNGSSFDNTGCGPPNGCRFGPEFQCTELAQRYAFYAWGEPANWYGYGGSQGSAAQMWSAGPALPIPLQQFPNGGGVPPGAGDLLIFGPGWLGSYWDGNGHVAVIRDVGANFVDVVQQNGTPTGTDRFPLNGSTLTANGYTPVLGWLRNTNQVPFKLASVSVAGSVRTVSDDAGDIDVFWRGGDNRIWTVSYRNHTWSSQATAISGPTVTGDPAVVSPSRGTIDVFWENSDHSLSLNTFTALWFGAGTWSGAQQVAAGPLASSPHAVTASGNGIDVFWRSADGGLYADTFSGSWSGAALITSTAMASDPFPVSMGNGDVDVLWRGPDANLWHDTLHAGAWSGTSLLGFGPLGSDPAVISAVPGNLDAFWTGQNGALWHAWSLSGSWNGPQQMSVQPITGKPDAVAEPGGKILVSVQRQDANVGLAMYSPASGWVGPLRLGDGPVASDPAVVAYAGGSSAAVFWRGQDGGLWSSTAPTL